MALFAPCNRASFDALAVSFEDLYGIVWVWSFDISAGKIRSPFERPSHTAKGLEVYRTVPENAKPTGAVWNSPSCGCHNQAGDLKSYRRVVFPPVAFFKFGRLGYR